ncbi:hypothetical protein MMC22_007416 [Lobaria immixta]|nr:hypothetical protein [Lobaria immixta]
MSSSLYGDATPEDVKNAKGIHLLTNNTPNGQKVQILLEELKELYGTKSTTSILQFQTGDHKKDWYLRLNPNGKIPTLIDNNQSPPFSVMESSAELLYLQATYDTNNEFGFKNPLEWSQALQWLYFWHGSAAPYLGQYAHFAKFSEEKIPYAIKRFKDETNRVLGVLEIHLSGKYTNEPRDYLAGNGKGKYSIADIGAWSWMRLLRDEKWREEFDLPPHVVKYIDRIAERPAAQRGIGKEYD